ncbi:carboxymuconolactone decarboxylase family protein [Bordetella petrii]|uniref:carboxymuconolactone decarboxylase family protein n=1 Tax=Bordetella petrii TaxID=94624 RepID=UPI00372DC29C
MSRIPLPSPDAMSADQKRVYEQIVSGPRGRLVGPLRAALHNPDLAERWQALGALLRYGTSLPPRVSELAILVTARRWNSQIEWHIHAQAAAAAGVPSAVIEAIRTRREPVFEQAGDAIAYEFSRQLQETGQVDQELYGRALAAWHVVGVVELTAVVGYYTMVSMTLNAHEIPMPDNAPAPLDTPLRDGRAALSRLPAAPGRER